MTEEFFWTHLMPIHCAMWFFASLIIGRIRYTHACVEGCTYNGFCEDEDSKHAPRCGIEHRVSETTAGTAMFLGFFWEFALFYQLIAWNASRPTFRVMLTKKPAPQRRYLSDAELAKLDAILHDQHDDIEEKLSA